MSALAAANCPCMMKMVLAVVLRTRTCHSLRIKLLKLRALSLLSVLPSGNITHTQTPRARTHMHSARAGQWYWNCFALLSSRTACNTLRL